MTSDDTILFVYHMKACGHRLVVRDAFGVGASHYATQLVGQTDFPLFYHLIIADDVQFHIRSHHGNAVYLFVAEKLAGNFDDALCAQFLAFEVETDGDVIAHVFQSQQGDYGEQLFGRNMVDNGSVFQSGNLQLLFFSFSIFLSTVLTIYELLFGEFLDLLQRDAQYIAQDGFACIQSVLCLLKIVGFGIVIHIVGYFVDTGQRV